MILEHRIEPLMNQLAESLIYKQPIDPRAYLIDLLQELIEAREKNTPPNGLLDRTNIAAIFGLIDIMGRGRYVLVHSWTHFSERLGSIRVKGRVPISNKFWDHNYF